MSSLNWQTFIALIGAGAWIPWIIKMLSKYFVKPGLRIKNFRRYLTINNNINGPYINISLSISTFRKAATIKNINVRFKNTESKEERTFEWYATTDVSIKRFVTKDGYAENLELVPAGIAIIEPNRQIMGDFSFNNFKDVDIFENTFGEILKKVGTEKIKDSNFIPDAAWIRSINDSIEMKNNFKKLATWKSGDYQIFINIYIFERNEPFTFEFKGNLEEFKIEMLLNDCSKFNNWVDSDDFVPMKEQPTFSYIYMSIDPV